MQVLSPRPRSPMNALRMRLMVELKEMIAALEPRVQGNPTAMLGLARMLQKDEQTEKAFAMCRAALTLAPDNAQLAAQARLLISQTVPQWHFNLVRDDARNAAYDAALRRAVTPTSRVRSEEHTSELQSRQYIVCRLLLEKKNARLLMLSCPTSDVA